MISSANFDTVISIKKMHRIGALSIVVIDPLIVRQLQLDEESYFVESLRADGVIELKPHVRSFPIGHRASERDG